MIQPARSLKITPTHLERKAIIYIWQSSPKQVRLNTESQRNQRALVERAQSLGWSQARIVVLDADLGQSVTDLAPNLWKSESLGYTLPEGVATRSRL